MLSYLPESMTSSINCDPVGEWLGLLRKFKDSFIQFCMLMMSNNNRANMFLNVSRMIKGRSAKCFFVFFNFVLIIILNKEISTSILI